MNKKNLKYLTATSLSLAIIGLIAVPSIVLGYNPPDVKPWDNNISIQQMLQTIVDILFTWIAPLCVLMIIWGGALYMTAGDDSSKHNQAFSFVKWALIGLAVVLAAGMLMSFVIGLGGTTTP